MPASQSDSSSEKNQTDRAFVALLFGVNDEDDRWSMGSDCYFVLKTGYHVNTRHGEEVQLGA